MIFITDKDLLAKIREIEGSNWNKLFDTKTYQPVLTSFQKWRAKAENEIELENSHYKRYPFNWETANTGIAMIGKNELNKYIIAGAGEVVFFNDLSDKEQLKKALAAGFRILEVKIPVKQETKAYHDWPPPDEPF